MNRPVEMQTPGATSPTPVEVAPVDHVSALTDMLPEQLYVLLQHAEYLTANGEDERAQRNAGMGAALLASLRTENNLLDELDKRGYWFPEHLLPSVRENIAEWVGKHLIPKDVLILDKVADANAAIPKPPAVLEVRSGVAVSEEQMQAPTATPNTLRKPQVAPREAAAKKAALSKTLYKVETNSDDQAEDWLWEEAKAEILSGKTSDENKDTLNLLTLYFNEASRRPLLNGAEEVELAKRIEAGVLAYEKVYLSDKKLLAQERRDLQAIVKDGERAKQHLLEANLRLVISRAKHKQGKGVAFFDLIQEGNLGLMHAVEMFDYTKGFKFSTYASNWIDRALDLVIFNAARTVRIPKHITQEWNGIQTQQRELTATLNREPTLTELAKKTGVSEKKLMALENLFRPDVSLDAPARNDDTEFTVGHTVADRNPDIPDQITAAPTTQYEALRGVVGDDELRVLHFITGLRGMSYEEIGSELGVNSDRVRFLRERAFAKMQHPSVTLGSYLDVKAGVPTSDDWRADAVCKDSGPDNFFASTRGGGSRKRHEAFCSECPVAALCLRYAVDHNIQFGYWGGMSAKIVNEARRKAERAGEVFNIPVAGSQVRKTA